MLLANHPPAKRHRHCAVCLSCIMALLCRLHCMNDVGRGNPSECNHPFVAQHSVR